LVRSSRFSDRISTIDDLESQRLDLSKRYLTKDTFSFLVSSSKTLSSPVLFAIVIFITQVVVFTLWWPLISPIWKILATC
jgi:hypothetical protein